MKRNRSAIFLMMAVYISRDVGASTEVVQFITHFLCQIYLNYGLFSVCDQSFILMQRQRCCPALLLAISSQMHTILHFDRCFIIAVSLSFSLYNAQLFACFQIFITNMNRTPNDRKINGKRDSKTLERNGKMR